MSNYTWQQSGQSSYPANPKRGDGDGCEPDFEPAGRPKDPSGTCPDVPCDKPPPLKDPQKCCPDPDCNCPVLPPSSSNCFDDLIAQQAKQISEAESAKAFKTELESLLTKAKAASLEYTQQKYGKLVSDWCGLDCQISELIRKLVCAVPCWRCLIECYVCPLLYEVRYDEQRLWGDGTLYTEVHSLSDLRYWLDRDQQRKKRVLDRIQGVLAAWEKPAQTIEKAIADNTALHAASGRLLSTDATKAVYDVFLQLVPKHLAIAPPGNSPHKTRIAKQYTEFCDCDKGEPDDCCGPDVGVPSLRQQLIGPQPYLIDPAKFFSVICCLTTERYLPAKNAYATAKSDFESVDNDYNRLKAEIVDKMKSIGTNAKASFPVDCNWEPQPASPAR